MLGGWPEPPRTSPDRGPGLKYQGGSQRTSAIPMSLAWVKEKQESDEVSSTRMMTLSFLGALPPGEGWPGLTQETVFPKSW